MNVVWRVHVLSQALSVALERQREQVRKKLEAKRQAKEYQEYEQDAAAHLINMASEQNEALAAKTTQEKGRQQDLVGGHTWT